MARTYDEDGTETRSIVQRMEKKKKELAMLDGPASKVKVYDDLPGGKKRVLPDLGAGRIGNVRLKKKGKV